MKIFPAILGIALILLGAVLLVGSLTKRGRDWNSTHNRSMQRRPRVSHRQEVTNSVLGVIGGLISLAGGAAAVINSIS